MGRLVMWRLSRHPMSDIPQITKGVGPQYASAMAQTSEPTTLETHSIEDTNDGKLVHFIARDTDCGFVGDFSVEYEYLGEPAHGRLRATDYETVRGMGGRYVEDVPSIGLLRHAAEIAEQQTNATVRHLFR